MLGPAKPGFLALSDIDFAGPVIAAPVAGQRGQNTVVQMQIPHPPAVLHMQVRAPDGSTDMRYSGNVIATDPHAEWRIPLALNDAAGTWSVTATDMASGWSATAAMAVP
jgi:hypothetical protein